MKCLHLVVISFYAILEYIATPEMDLPSAQQSVARIAAEIRRCARRLEALRRQLPATDDARLEAMEQGRHPFDTATVVLGAVDCALNEWLPRAAGELERAAAVSQEVLDAEWRAGRPRGG